MWKPLNASGCSGKILSAYFSFSVCRKRNIFRHFERVLWSKSLSSRCSCPRCRANSTLNKQEYQIVVSYLGQKYIFVWEITDKKFIYYNLVNLKHQLVLNPYFLATMGAMSRKRSIKCISKIINLNYFTNRSPILAFFFTVTSNDWLHEVDRDHCNCIVHGDVK